VEVLNLKGATLVRFVTTTTEWSEHTRSSLCVPDRWPFMLVELILAADGQTTMSSVIGIPRSSLSAFRFQGIYSYPFHELPDLVLTAVTTHFTIVHKRVLQRANVLGPARKRPGLTLVTNDAVACLTERRPQAG
jgi:hypothetical protein